MQQNALLYGIIGLLIGVVLTVAFLHLGHRGMHDKPAKHGMGMQSTMDGMMGNLEGKTGDEFDKAFIEEMIVHHQGAIDMAEMALQNGSHAEIKTLANAIIAAQTKEISEMKAWYKLWFEVDIFPTATRAHH